jgi:hypothetical protein
VSGWGGRAIKRQIANLGALDKLAVPGLKILDLLASAGLRRDLGLQLGGGSGLWEEGGQRERSEKRSDSETYDILLELGRVVIGLVHVDLEERRLVVHELVLVAEVTVGLLLASL